MGDNVFGTLVEVAPRANILVRVWRFILNTLFEGRRAAAVIFVVLLAYALAQGALAPLVYAPRMSEEWLITAMIFGSLAPFGHLMAFSTGVSVGRVWH